MTQTLAQSFTDYLQRDANPLLERVSADLAREVYEFAESRGPVPADALATAELLVDFARAQLRKMAELQDAFGTFSVRYGRAIDVEEQSAAILEFAHALGSSGAALRSDERALEKHFDADAVTERFRKRLGERERALVYALDRLGVEAGAALTKQRPQDGRALMTNKVGPLLADMREYQGDARVRAAAHGCLARMAELAPGRLAGFWLDRAISDTRRIALDAGEDGWVQCRAFDALFSASPESLKGILALRLERPSEPGSSQRDDNRIFVRRHLARLLAASMVRQPHLEKFFVLLSRDRDGAVRQAVAECLPRLGQDSILPLLGQLAGDEDPQVRAMVFADTPALAWAAGGRVITECLTHFLVEEEDEFVLRLTFQACTDFLAWTRAEEADQLQHRGVALADALRLARSRSTNPKLRRWAGEALERMWLMCDERACALAQKIESALAGMREGVVRTIPELAETIEDDPELVGRVLAVFAQGEFGLELETGRTPKLHRGERFGRKLWRILFEMRNSATDKRQAFYHSVGRRFTGALSAPSARMAELAPTKIPGEPLFNSGEGGWRNYVPLPDQVLATIDRGGETRIFTSEGVTRLSAPRSLLRRLRAYWSISVRFSRFADMRNRDPHHFIESLREKHVEVSFAPHGGRKEWRNPPDPEITKLFQFGPLLITLPAILDDTWAYVATVYENSLAELAVFIVLVSAYFFGRQIWIGRRVKRLRRHLPLSLGGWGTRGKSGTERLKAGLINALGAPLVSKTTGCEAMFLLGNAHGGLIEMFLFRPYDKATIWEQVNLLQISSGLGARVFLWECMGLNPSYVKILQQDWMCDDIATITNTYPDHEDVQGPAGRNIPEVMCEFIPANSILLTSEEEMLPILRQGADRQGTRLETINWKQAGLIHQRLLERFPYAEHPYNIALVTQMGRELGLSPDFCVKEMADRVVADLGVLKIYPRARVHGATLEFVMGMSANERFGAMGNWQRMGFVDHALDRDPEIFVSTVVNNRADRVPRSRVFARMLANDLSVDRHFLIGSNIDGLLDFIKEEWEAHAAELSLFEQEADPLARLGELAKRQRIPLTEAEVEGRVAAMLAGSGLGVSRDKAGKALGQGRLDSLLAGAEPEVAARIKAHADELRQSLAEYQALHAEVARGGDHAGLNRKCRDLLGKAFMAKIVPVRDFYITGEQLIRMIARNTPPGLVNRIMGMQNIKGTGLDFVYTWQAWEAVEKACCQLEEEDPAQSEKGYQLLSSFQEFGRLSEARVQEAIANLRDRRSLPPSIPPGGLEALETRLASQIAAVTDHAGSAGDASGGRLKRGWKATVKFMESFLDVSDAVMRRRAADRIYAALIAEQISSQRAALELKKLTTRQKGGWFTTALQSKIEAVQGAFGAGQAARAGD